MDELEEHDIQAFRGSEQDNDINICLMGRPGIWYMYSPILLTTPISCYRY